jgi:alpha-tubulin suppressor-like RCC1 family protein
LTGLNSVKTIAAGLKHSIALKSDGTVWGWGDNYYGQIGTGALGLGLQYNSPAPVAGLSGIIAISAGEYHSLALKNDGTVWVWGRNNLGQLGTGDSIDKSAPYKLTTLTSIRDIAAGSNFTLALQNDGTVLAWGYNGYGQLGNMSYVSSQSPAAVIGITGVSSIAAGYNHSIALKGNGTVWGWGENLTGGLGDGTNTTSNIPVQVSTITGVRSISTGNRFTTALKADGNVYAWGWNNWGQLGDKSNTDKWVPVQTSNLSAITALSSGYSHSTAIKSDGTIYTWGSNLYGQLGNGTTIDNNEPLTVTAMNIGSTSAVTTPTPLGGTFANAITVILTASEASTVYYTVDGTTPSVGGPTTLIYTLPINISVTTTLKFFSVSLSSAKSEDVKTEIYTIDPIPVTTADPIGGTYTIVQTVTLASNKPGTTYYTTDGSTPAYPVGTTTTQIYTGSITISNTTTLNYFTRAFDANQELPKSQTYIINIPPVTTASPLGGTYTSVQTVTLSMNKPGYIYYTLDGSIPTYPATGTTQIYTGALTISATTTLRYFSRAFDATQEALNSQTYTINIPPITTANPIGGTYAPGQTVTLTSSKPGTIYFTIDGTTPTFPMTGTTQTYSGTLIINTTTTLNYFTRANDTTQEAVKTQTYAITNLPFTTPAPPEGTYLPGQTVTLTSNKPGTIYFTVDGTIPSYPASGTTQVYSTAFAINVTTTLKFFCRSNDGYQEAVQSKVYTISNLPVTTATPAGGTYTSVQSVTLTASKPSTIYYTTDGSTPTFPTSASTQTYSAPITVGTTSTLRFFAIDIYNSSNQELVKAESYIINIPVPNQLTVVVQGGTSTGSTVNSSPAPDINCKGYCIQNYSTGLEVVTLTASPSGADVFVGWSGACTGTAPCTVTMSSSRSVTATFAPIGTVSIEPKIAAGYWHTVAVKSDGSVWTWGNNSDGQLGTGDYITRTVPAKVTPIKSVIAVAAGDYHTLALRNDGTVWSWGYNNYGQLGDGTVNVASDTPILVKNLSGIISIAAGAGHSIALRNDGTVWAWGNNIDGQLGNGSTVNSNLPVQVSGLSGMTAISAGWLHSVALRSNGTVWAWGANSDGQLGNNTLITPQTTPAQVSNLSGVTAIAAGGYHTVSLKSDSTVWTWGKNDNGQLGNGTIFQSSLPVEAMALNGVTAIAAGGAYTVALKSDFKVWMWGNDSYYTMPFIGSVNSSTPVEMVGISNAYKIAAGYFHTIIMKSDSSVNACGYNNAGQLGNGTASLSTTPVQVLGLYLDASACYAKIGASCYASLSEAYAAIPVYGIATILLQNRTYNELVDFNRTMVDITLEGGYDPSFSVPVGNSTVNMSSMTLTAGSVAVGKNVLINMTH